MDAGCYVGRPVGGLKSTPWCLRDASHNSGVWMEWRKRLLL